MASKKATIKSITDMAIDTVATAGIEGIKRSAEESRAHNGQGAFFHWMRAWGCADVGMSVTFFPQLDGIRAKVSINVVPAFDRSVAETLAALTLIDQVCRLAALIEARIIEAGPISVE